MPTQRQRREAERRRLERQLQRRREREVRRRRVVLITSIVGTIAVIGIVVGFLVANSGGKSTPSAAGNGSSSSAAPTPTAPTAPSSTGATACGQQQFPAKKVRPAKGAAVSFAGVTVKGAADLGGKPGVTSTSAAAPPKLEVKDLVVGKGKPAAPSSCVTIQYDGVLYKNGTEFDSSWSRSMLAQFSLTGVVKGFTQGIGGTTGVTPMKVGGRRIIVLPASLGYGAQAQGKIPANAPLVFVVDLTNVTAAQ